MPTTLIEQLEHAVDVLSAEPVTDETLKGQAEGWLRAEVDDATLEALTNLANRLGRQVFYNACEHGADPVLGVEISRAAILISGLTMGKRLGQEQGEAFGRMTAGFEGGAGI